MKYLLILLLAVCGGAQAANVFVRAAASGSNDGTNWTNAYTAMPTVSANNTYYIADGSYSGGTIAVSNVTIKKCSTTDGVSSGTTGYLSTYCDGKATFTSSWFTTGQRANVVIDGSYRNESDWADYAAYGFTLSDGFLSIDGLTGGDYCVTEFTIKYTHLGITPNAAAPGSYADNVLKGTGYRTPYCRAWTVQRNLLNNAQTYCLFCANGFVDPVIEYNKLMYGWGKEAIRGQIRFSDGIIRYNIFYDACGNGGAGCTGEIALWDDADFDGNKIYGNTFYQSGTNNHDGPSDATITIGGDNGVSSAGPPVIDTLVYNNTFYGNPGGNHGRIRIYGSSSSNTCRNNLWYNTTSTTITCTTTSNNVNAGANPFVSAPANLRLSGATAAGFTLSSPYNADMDGLTRGGDGTWDVGAYEYDEGGGSPPGAPSNFRLVNWAGWLLIIGGMVGLFRSLFNGKNNPPGGRITARGSLGDVAGAQTQRVVG